MLFVGIKIWTQMLYSLKYVLDTFILFSGAKNDEFCRNTEWLMWRKAQSDSEDLSCNLFTTYISY